MTSFTEDLELAKQKSYVSLRQSHQQRIFNLDLPALNLIYYNNVKLLFLPPSFKFPLSIRVFLLDEVEKDHVTEESSLLMQV